MNSGNATWFILRPMLHWGFFTLETKRNNGSGFTASIELLNVTKFFATGHDNHTANNAAFAKMYGFLLSLIQYVKDAAHPIHFI